MIKDERIERDSLGEVRVPASALYGAQTQRAVDNFPISGLRLPRAFVRALGLTKRAAALVNRDLGLLDATVADAIETAANEVVDGWHDEHSGTPSCAFAPEIETNSSASADRLANSCRATGKWRTIVVFNRPPGM